MLKITVRLSESFDDEKQEFISDDFELELEHSLVSLSKWESKYKKFFLDDGKKTTEETLGYIESMILTPVYPADIVTKLSQENYDAITDYINDSMTATTFPEQPKSRSSREKISNELIYYWMVAYQIPWEAQHWHLSRLFTLIRVCNAKNDTKDKKKRTTSEIMAERRELNERRMRELGTSG